MVVSVLLIKTQGSGLTQTNHSADLKQSEHVPKHLMMISFKPNYIFDPWEKNCCL